MAIGGDGGRRREVVETLRGMLRRQLRQTRALERAAERATDELLLLEQALDEVARSGSADGLAIPIPARPKPERRDVSWFASAVVLSTRGPSSFVVGTVRRAVPLTPLQLELVAILSATTQDSDDGLVGFQTIDAIALALRTKYKRTRTSRRSIVVAIGRLRDRLGPVYRDLIESQPGKGYRVRVMPG
jgi:hypothetical protein